MGLNIIHEYRCDMEYCNSFVSAQVGEYGNTAQEWSYSDEEGWKCPKHSAAPKEGEKSHD